MPANEQHNPDFLRSFGRRKGRVLPAYKQNLVDELLPQLVPSHNLSADNEYWLEIGFGAGEHLFNLAKTNVDKHIIGAEPYLNGVATLLTRLDKEPLANLSIINDDVRPWMQSIPDGSLSAVYILFPDPWPKRNHNKRRIVNNALLDLIAQKLKKNGILRIATDHVDYSAWIMEHMIANISFEWQVNSCNDWQNTFSGWQETRYQQKTTEQGRLPIFLEFTNSLYKTGLYS